ncbi:MAG: hypothetical protein V5A37_05840 [Halobacteriales archaeon]
MMDDSRTRRQFLRAGGVAGVMGTAGCVEFLDGNATPEDIDGDGVANDEDYAPRDEEVQRKEQVACDGENGPATPTGGPREVVVDDFELGELENAWEIGVSGTNTPSNPAATFDVQSSAAPEGQYALLGRADEFGYGSSTLTRSDFLIDEDGASIRLYLRVGERLGGAEQANRVFFRSPEADENVVVMFDQKTTRDDYEGRIVDERLRSIRPVEVNGIDFTGNRIEEVRIGGETVRTDVPFQSRATSITAVEIRQGHFGQPSNVLVDDIRLEEP